MRAAIQTIATAVAVVLFAAGTVAQEPPKKTEPPKPANVAGKWTMSLEMSIGTATPVLVLKQDGEKLTGTYTGRYGTFELKGTVKEQTIAFSFPMGTDGGDTTMSFKGTVAADGLSMKGDGAIDGLGEISWTAKKDKEGGPERSAPRRSALLARVQ